MLSILLCAKLKSFIQPLNSNNINATQALQIGAKRRRQPGAVCFCWKHCKRIFHKTMSLFRSWKIFFCLSDNLECLIAKHKNAQHRMKSNFDPTNELIVWCLMLVSLKKHIWYAVMCATLQTDIFGTVRHVSIIHLHDIHTLPHINDSGSKENRFNCVR